jgi:hypothetical protein
MTASDILDADPDAKEILLKFDQLSLRKREDLSDSTDYLLGKKRTK